MSEVTTLPNRRLRIDINDDDNNKITLSFEGFLTREKILQVLDFIDLLGGSPTVEPEEIRLSKFEKVQSTIRMRFPIGWFTSQEVMIAYEDTFNEPIGLSTISTYISRLTKKDMLKKTGSRNKRKYKLIDKKNRNRNTRYHISR